MGIERYYRPLNRLSRELAREGDNDGVGLAKALNLHLRERKRLLSQNGAVSHGRLNPDLVAKIEPYVRLDISPQQEEDIVRSLTSYSDLSNEVIASIVGTTSPRINRISSKLLALGKIQPRGRITSSHHTHLEISRLIEEGFDTSEIAEKLKIPEKRIKKNLSWEIESKTSNEDKIESLSDRQSQIFGMLWESFVSNGKKEYVGLTPIAEKLKVTREDISSIYSKIKNKGYPLPPTKAGFYQNLETLEVKP
jgi:hypothetical protein